MKLLVGLGNPGKKYQFTRHNVGFMILDKVINILSVQEWDKKFDCCFKKIMSNEKNILLIKPLTYMNLSGIAVQKVKSFYNIDKKNIIVIHDDIDLELGNEFIRIRIGVGRPEKIDVSSYVLNNFLSSEVSLLKKIILKSCEGIKLLTEDRNEECKKFFSKKDH